MALNKQNDSALLLQDDTDLLRQSESASSTDNLLADDVESSSEITSPQLGQVHALTSTDVESASEITSPQLGQVHALAAGGIESASETTSPNAVSVVSESEITFPGLEGAKNFKRSPPARSKHLRATRPMGGRV